MADTAAVAIVRNLQALRRRYRDTGNILESRVVERCIEIARERQADPPDQATPGDQDPCSNGGSSEPDSWLLGRFTRST